MIILIWLALCLVVAILAAKRDRNPIGWALLALVLSPVVAGIILLVLGEGRTARCMYCAERIKETARICPHCQREHRSPIVDVTPRREA